MATQITYPGVYIEEVPGGSHTITGVATSITAFIGRTLRGPINEPTNIYSYADFVLQFGGLYVDSPLSYAVHDFYLNGGGQAIILRLYKAPEGTNGVATTTIDTLKLEASNPGQWGNALRVIIDHTGITDETAKNIDQSLTKDDLFNLTVKQINLLNPAEVIQEEIFKYLTLKESSRRIDRVLSRDSNLISLQNKNDISEIPTNVPFENDIYMEFTGGANSDYLEINDYLGSEVDKTGYFALEKADLFNLLCIPPDKRNVDINPLIFQKAMAYCELKRAMLIIDSPYAWSENKETAVSSAKDGLDDLGLSGTAARNAAIYFPHVIIADPLKGGQLEIFVPCGIVAGIFTRTDAQRGVWKAPAGQEAGLSGVTELSVPLTDDENGELNQLGINCLRAFPVYGRLVWGARTLEGADRLASQWKYISVRRTALFIEESLYRGTQWVVFEPNDESLWAQIRLIVGAFMQNLFRQGAFQGVSPKEAYFVKCDKETTTQSDIDPGIVNILVGFAPLKPAEFIIIRIQQKTDMADV